MSEIDHINVFEDRAFQQRILRWSAIVVCAGIAVAGIWVAAVGAINQELGLAFHAVELFWIDAFWPWALSLIVAVLAALVAHELVHGFFFRQFAPPGSRVSYGINWKRGMAYACAEGIVYSRAHYEVVILAPTVVVTGALAAIGIGLGWPIWTITAVVAHLSGCTGDWGYLAVLRANPGIRWCEDTSWGVRFFGEDAPGGAAGLHVVEGRGSGAGADKAGAAGAAGGAAGAVGAVGGAGAASAVGGAASVVGGAASIVGGAAKVSGADEAGGTKGAPGSAVGATVATASGRERAGAPGGVADGAVGASAAGDTANGTGADELVGAMSEDEPVGAVDGAVDSVGGTAKVPGANGRAGVAGAPAAAGAIPRESEGAGAAGAGQGIGLGAAPPAEATSGAEPVVPGAAPTLGKLAEEPPTRPVFVLVSGGARGAGASREPESVCQAFTSEPHVSAPGPDSLPQDPAAGE